VATRHVSMPLSENHPANRCIRSTEFLRSGVRAHRNLMAESVRGSGPLNIDTSEPASPGRRRRSVDTITRLCRPWEAGWTYRRPARAASPPSRTSRSGTLSRPSSGPRCRQRGRPGRDLLESKRRRPAGDRLRPLSNGPSMCGSTWPSTRPMGWWRPRFRSRATDVPAPQRIAARSRRRRGRAALGAGGASGDIDLGLSLLK
jgi:hypothetical protein